ncbi:MAG TPA: DNA repair protein RecN [Actinobacteria bacterium]|nr:DNA repair protein RecN [Actinomycetota bacterium]
MLKELQVKNFAIIDDVRIIFGKGLNILSGETGAGKTLIIEAINLLIGERADSELIREDREKLLVQGYFDFSRNTAVKEFLLEHNIVDEQDFQNDIVISRELNRTGKNKAFINGLFTQVSILKGLGDCFLDLHGQHDHQYLLESGTHIKIVDDFGKDIILPIKKGYSYKYELYADWKRKLEDLLRMHSNSEARLQDLNYRYQEISKLKVEEGEEKKLENELRILKNFESIYKLASETEDIINSSDLDKSNLSDKIFLMQKNIGQLASIDNRFKDFSERIGLFTDIIEEISHFLSSYLADLDFSKDRLDAIQERLYSFSAIKKKYNIDIQDTGHYIRKLKEEIDSYQSLDQDIDKANKQLILSKGELLRAAKELSSARGKAAKQLEEKVISGLNGLGFGSAVFEIKKYLITDTTRGRDNPKFTKNGIDAIEIFISLNAGENPRPLKKIASGGEISRIMLALKSALGAADNISTMIFDEIDSGIGGAIALVVGEKLFNISLKKQIIAISHLAQIACFSTSHYFIDKYVQKGRTMIKINKLGQDERVEEISRMLGGMKDSDISIKHAGELIGKADIIKNSLKKEAAVIGN